MSLFIGFSLRIQPGLVAQSDACLIDDHGHGFDTPVRHYSFVEINHEIFSTVILSLPLILEGKLSSSCIRMTITVHRGR